MTKTLKPVLAMSIAALTLLAGCAKGDANTAYSKAKKEIKSQYAVKSFDKAFYVHSDVSKWLKTEDGKNASEDAKADAKARGNSVSVTYTFTLKDGKQQIWTCSYTTKDKDFKNVNASVATLIASVDSIYNESLSAAQKTYADSAYITVGTLKK